MFELHHRAAAAAAAADDDDDDDNACCSGQQIGLMNDRTVIVSHGGHLNTTADPGITHIQAHTVETVTHC